ncbi:MAG: cysteine hydrolase family protein [Gemmatimonadota bacterium]
MARLLFWDVDTQADFFEPSGRLPIPGAGGIRPVLKRLTAFARDRKVRILASADDHLAGHRELSDHPDYIETFPPHCMRGSQGQKKIPETALQNPLVIEPEHQDAATLARVQQHAGDFLLHKHWFDVFTNSNVLPLLRTLDPQVIVMYGVATDGSDRYAIEGLAQHRPHTRIYFVTDAARAFNPKAAEHLLKEWAEEGVRLVKSEEILEGGVLENYFTA